MTRKIKNHLIWIVRCYRIIIRVIQKKIIKFLTLVLANFVDALIIAVFANFFLSLLFFVIANFVDVLIIALLIIAVYVITQVIQTLLKF